MKKSPWLSGDYSSGPNNNRPVNPVAHGSDSRSLAIGHAEIPGSLSFTTSVVMEKGIKRNMEDIALWVPSIASELAIAIEKKKSTVTVEELDCAMALVIDGHGGRAVAEYVSINMAQHLANGLVAKHATLWNEYGWLEEGELADAFATLCAEAFYTIDREVVVEVPTSMKEGCTVVITLFPLAAPKPYAITVNVGDSQAHLLRHADLQGENADLTNTEETEVKANSIELSTLHKPWSLQEKARITSHDAVVERGRINGILDVSRSIGDVTFKRYGVSPIPTVAYMVLDNMTDEMIVLGSDGLFNTVQPAKLFEKIKNEIVKQHKKLVMEGTVSPNTRTLSDQVVLDAVSNIIDEVVYTLKCQDNVSMIVVYNRSHKIV